MWAFLAFWVPFLMLVGVALYLVKRAERHHQQRLIEIRNDRFEKLRYERNQRVSNRGSQQ